jgi:hypothetical protein
LLVEGVEVLVEKVEGLEVEFTFITGRKGMVNAEDRF